MKLARSLIGTRAVPNSSHKLILIDYRSSLERPSRARLLATVTVGVVGTRHWRYQLALLYE